jgi:2-methylcitrate dehydratase PrpD
MASRISFMPYYVRDGHHLPDAGAIRRRAALAGHPAASARARHASHPRRRRLRARGPQIRVRKSGAAGNRVAGRQGRHVVIGQKERLPLRDAVLANGILAHGLDYDDTHTEGIAHLTVATFPAAFAVAVHEKTSGRELLSAYIAAMEAGARLASVAKGKFHDAGFHPTGVIGAFSAALAAGRLYQLDEQKLACAQGVALSTAAGSLEFLADGAWTKRFHAGWAGVGGVTAAAMARHGFVAPLAAYEGRFGLFNAYLKQPVDTSRATAALGTAWELMNVAVKPFPACHFAHAFADAALALRPRINLEKVERITALVPEGIVKVVCEPAGSKRRPASDYDAKFSVPYIVAASLVRGRFSLAELDEEALNDARILQVAAKVDYRVDPDSTFPRHYSGGIHIRSSDGSQVVHHEPINRGNAERPLGGADVVAKFMENCASVHIRDAVLALEDSEDLDAFSSILEKP